MKFNQDDVLSRVSPIAVLRDAFPKLNNPNSDGWVTGLKCPWRDDKRASFTVNVEHGGFKDFGNEDEKGSLIEFVKRWQNIDYKDAIKFLADRYAVGLSDAKPVAAPPKPAKKNRTILSNDAQKYIKNATDNLKSYPYHFDKFNRAGIKDAVLKECKVALKKIRRDNRYYEQSIFPYNVNDKGDIVSYKAKSHTGNPKYDHLTVNCKSQKMSDFGEQCFFPYFINRDDTRIILVEGERDALALRSRSIEAFSVAFGANTFTDAMAEVLRGRDVTILYDNDNAGKKGAVKAGIKLVEHGAKVKVADFSLLDVNQYFNDACDFFEKGGKTTDIIDLINNAVDFEPDKDFNDTSNTIDWSDVRDNVLGEGKITNPKFAEWFVSVYQVIYVSGEEKTDMYYRYSDGYWTTTSKPALEHMINDILFNKLGFTSFTARNVTDIIKMVERFGFVDEKRIDQRHDLINLNNCAYDLINHKPIPHNPDHYLTYKTSYDYNPSADCPEWLDALDMYSIGSANANDECDNDWIGQMQDIFGYCLTHDYDIHLLIHFYGETGRNGKSKIVTALKNLVSPHLAATDFQMNHLDKQFSDILRLRGKRVAFVPETPKIIKSFDMIKKLTGGDDLFGNVKFSQKGMGLRNNAKMILLSNNPLRIDSEESISPFLERLRIVPFRYQIPRNKRRKDIDTVFGSELSGIFNWAINGLKRVQQTNTILEAESSRESLANYRSDINQFFAFMTNNVIIDDEGSVRINVLWAKYQEHMRSFLGNNWIMMPDQLTNTVAIGRAINSEYKHYFYAVDTKDYDSEQKSNKTNTRYFGMRLKSDHDYQFESGETDNNDRFAVNNPYVRKLFIKHKNKNRYIKITNYDRFIKIKDKYDTHGR
jgi:putative DNA primase/helicase